MCELSSAWVYGVALECPKALTEMEREGGVMSCDGPIQPAINLVKKKSNANGSVENKV